MLLCAWISLPLLAGVPANDEPAADEAVEQLLVVNHGDGSIVVLQPDTGARAGVVRVGAGPCEIAISSDGRTAIVPNYGGSYGGQTLSVVDVPSLRHRRTIQLRFESRRLDGTTEKSTYHRPHGAAFLPGDRQAVVTAESESVLLLVDLEQGRVIAAIETDQALSNMVLISRDGRRAFVSNKRSGSISVVNLGRYKLEKVIETGGGASGMALHPTRPELWVANRENDSISVIDTDSFKEIREFPCGAEPVRIAAFEPQ